MLDPANEMPWFFFCMASTQLRSAGMGGIVGLDYGALFGIFDLYGVPHWKRADLFEDIRVIERIALKRWNEDVKASKTAQRPTSTRHDPRRPVR